MVSFKYELLKLRAQIKDAIIQLLETQPEQTITYSWGCKALPVTHCFCTLDIDIRKAVLENGDVLLYNADEEYPDETYRLEDVSTVDALVDLYELLVDGIEATDEE